jgi:uncharacterized damage-inducible protein DinB
MGLVAENSSAALCQELLQFHDWRRKMVSEVLEAADKQLFDEQLKGSFGSLYIILNHLVWAEKVWLGRVDRSEVATMKSSDVSGLIKAWEEVSGKWLALVQSASEDLINREIVYYNSTGDEFKNTVKEIVIHMVDHSTYHVGQMMNALRAFGVEPVSTNYIHYLRAKS